MTPDAKRPSKPDELLLWLRGRYPNDTDEELTKRFREHARDRPESPEEKTELQKRVNSLVDKWAVQHAERLKAAKRRRTQSK